MIFLIILLISFIIYQLYINYLNNKRTKENIKIYTELTKLYTNLSQNISLLNKASELTLKQQQQSTQDVIDFKNQVSEVVLLMLEASGINPLSENPAEITLPTKPKGNKTKPN